MTNSVHEIDVFACYNFDPEHVKPLPIGDQSILTYGLDDHHMITPKDTKVKFFDLSDRSIARTKFKFSPVLTQPRLINSKLVYIKPCDWIKGNQAQSRGDGTYVI